MKVFTLIVLVILSTITNAATVNLSWDDNVNDPTIVGGYDVYVGTASGSYSDIFDAGPAKTFTVNPLANNTLYYFAATTYPKDPTLTASRYSNEVSVRTPLAPLTVNFKASATTGKAPLSINFTPILNEPVITCLWKFGDGSQSTTCNPAHTYRYVGYYSVSLTVANTTSTVATTKTNYIHATRR